MSVFVVLSLTPSLRLQEPIDWETGDGSGPGETGQNRADRDNAGGDSNTERYRGAGTPDKYIFYYFCILSTHPFYSLVFFLVVSFSADCNNRQGGTGRGQCLQRKQHGTGEQQVYVF